MTVGITTIDDAACAVVEARLHTIAYANSAGPSHEVTVDHISKIWKIPFDESVQTLDVTTQWIQQVPKSSLSCNARTNDRTVRY